MKWEEFYEDLQSADDAEHLFQQIALYARQLGFAYCSYLMRVPSLNTSPKFIMFDTCPPGWKEHYMSSKFSETDPVIRFGMNSIEPLTWSEKLFSDTPQLWSDIRAFGLKVGISQPCWAAHGVFGLLSFMRPETPLTTGEIGMLRRQMQIVTNLLHISMYERMGISKMTAASDVNLTLREREILRWTSEGKTAEIIGKILNISTRTVNFHISNVLLKLVAVNKVQAVVKARTLGLL